MTQLKWLIRILGINLAATGTAMLILHLFGNQASRAQWATNLSYSLIYSNCIGTLVSLAFPSIVRFSARRRAPLNGIILIAILLLLATIGCLMAGLIFVAIGLEPLSHYWQRFTPSFHLSLLITISFGVAMFIYHSLRQQLEAATLQLHAKELAEARALKLAAEARLSMLASQIHPHFLFNTLNSISALIQEDPLLAERLIERLAALLRFSLDANQHPLVSLEQEIKIVTDYLEIEKARFNKRLNYTIELSGECRQLRLPPLSLQTLVENSVKYAIAPNRAGGRIAIIAGIVEERLYLEVVDSGSGFSREQILPGHGIDNLQARLNTLFNDQVVLEIAVRADGCAVIMSLPQQAVSEQR